MKNRAVATLLMAHYLRPLRTAVIEGGSYGLESDSRTVEAAQGKAKIKWGKLTDDEIDVVEGRRDELVGKIQQRYGIAKDQAEREVDDWMKEF